MMRLLCVPSSAMKGLTLVSIVTMEGGSSLAKQDRDLEIASSATPPPEGCPAPAPRDSELGLPLQID